MLLQTMTFLFLSLVCFNTICEGAHVEIGSWSYGNPKILEWGDNTSLKIGKYCSIAEQVQILLGGEHRTDWVTTFPFPAFWPIDKPYAHARSKGDVIIGNDVWIGYGALILSGVKIGDGAVVGARAIVAKDVPPYAIVVGNPAKIIKYRFGPQQIKKLLAIAWWDWPEEEIIKAMPYLLNDDIRHFIKYCRDNNKL